jgi:isopenicillin-N N-acyltransferase-like protein
LATGCSAVAVQPSVARDGHLLLAENWDWIPEVRGALVLAEEPDGTRSVGFTEAGIFGAKIGLSDHGLGLAINGLLTTDDDWARLERPFHVRCYEVLRSRTLEDGQHVLVAGGRACSANFLIAQVPDRVLDVETAPTTVRCLGPARGRLVHTNHFLDATSLGVTQPPMDDWYTHERYARLETLLDGRERIGQDDLRAFLADHEGYPGSVCAHPNPAEPPEERVMTVTSVVMDLTARTLAASDGPPCANPYQVVGLGD